MKIRKSFSFLIGSFLCLSSVFGQIASPPTVVGDLSICLSGSAVLTANDPTNTPGATFRWYIDQPLLLPDIFIQESDSIVLGPLLVSGNY
ncbi:MAG: immunoglobulin domain-containing protein, partial [Luteibaculum sp.]